MYKWVDVPDALVPGPGDNVSNAHKEILIRRNWPRIKENMSVYYPRNELHKLAMTEEDFVTFCNVWCYDFTSLGEKAVTGDMRYKNYQGHIDLNMTFSRNLPHDNAFLLIAVCEYENTFMIMIASLFSLSKK